MVAQTIYDSASDIARALVQPLVSGALDVLFAQPPDRAGRCTLDCWANDSVNDETGGLALERVTVLIPEFRRALSGPNSNLRMPQPSYVPANISVPIFISN